MSGVWVFKQNGVFQLIENPSTAETNNGSSSNTQAAATRRRKTLIHLPSGEAVTSYAMLSQILRELGWERYYGPDNHLFQFHKRCSIDLISLPKDFAKFNSIYMYDIVIKNPNIFHVRDV